jgi:hypothetical protein
MLWTILVILVLLWLVGFFGHIGGGMIHILLLMAVALLVFKLMSRRRAV